MRAYAAVRWVDEEVPEVGLYNLCGDAIDWLLYPWAEDMSPTAVSMMRLDLLNGRTVRIEGSNLVVLNLEVQ